MPNTVNLRDIARVYCGWIQPEGSGQSALSALTDTAVKRQPTVPSASARVPRVSTASDASYLFSASARLQEK